MSNLGNELSCRSYWLEDYYEPLSMVAIDALSSQVETFLDVGSNTGIFSLFAGSASEPPRVIAFEPNPKIREILESNCRLNSLQVEISPVALSDSTGESTFYLTESDTSGCLDVDFNPVVTGSYKVETSTLDKFCSSEGIDGESASSVLIKMDVLGHESSILRGGRRITEKLKPIYLLEAVREYEAAEIEHLKANGYTFNLIAPSGLELVDEIAGVERDGFFFGNLIATCDPAVVDSVDQALRNLPRTPDFGESSLCGFDGYR